jgi:hypothetical protein
MNHPSGITAGSPRLRDAVLPIMAATGRQADHQALVEAAQQSLKGLERLLCGEQWVCDGTQVHDAEEVGSILQEYQEPTETNAETSSTNQLNQRPRDDLIR